MIAAARARGFSPADDNEADAIAILLWASFADKVGQEPQMRRPRPGPRQITEAEEALLWLRWLDKDIGQILWARANRKAWKGICREHGVSRATANRRWEYGLAVIVWRLNGKRVPKRRSMQFVVSKAREA